MTRAQLLFKTGKHTYSGTLACAWLHSLCRPPMLLLLLLFFCFPLYAPLCTLRFLPPAYSISSRMLTQTPMSPYMSPISTYQVLKSALFSYTTCCTSILKYLQDSCCWGSTRRFWVKLVNVWQRAPWPFALVAVPTRSVGSTCALEIADVLVFTECLCDVLGAEPLLGPPSGLHHATPGEKNRLDSRCHDFFLSFFLR